MLIQKLKILLLFACLSFYSSTSIADDGTTIPVIPSLKPGQGTHRAPSQQSVYAILDMIDITLSLVVSSELEVLSVEIYKDGNLIITDNTPSFYYLLSTYGSGNYSIHLKTKDEMTYIGNYTIV